MHKQEVIVVDSAPMELADVFIDSKVDEENWRVPSSPTRSVSILLDLEV
jgi:hypothetical protein